MAQPLCANLLLAAAAFCGAFRGLSAVGSSLLSGGARGALQPQAQDRLWRPATRVVVRTFAVPKRKVSRSRGGKRRNAIEKKLKPRRFYAECEKCGNVYLPHQICNKCEFALGEFYGIEADDVKA